MPGLAVVGSAGVRLYKKKIKKSNSCCNRMRDQQNRTEVSPDKNLIINGRNILPN